MSAHRIRLRQSPQFKSKRGLKKVSRTSFEADGESAAVREATDIGGLLGVEVDRLLQGNSLTAGEVRTVAHPVALAATTLLSVGDREETRSGKQQQEQKHEPEQEHEQRGGYALAP